MTQSDVERLKVSIVERLAASTIDVHAISKLKDNLNILKQQDPKAAEDLDLSLKKRIQDLTESHTQAIDSLLGQLEGQEEYDPKKVADVKRVRDLLGELEELAPDRVGERRSKLKSAERRLKGMKLLHEAQQDAQKTMFAVKDRESKGNTGTIVADANNLRLRMGDRIDKAVSVKIPPDIMARLRRVGEECKKFHAIKRAAYLEAMTADGFGEFEKAYTSLKFVKENEGAQAMVLYFKTVGTEVQTQVNVEIAISVCETRWGNFLAQRAKNHLEIAKDYLKPPVVNPREADRELKQVEHPDRLPDEMQEEYTKLRQRVDSEQQELNTFEQEIDEERLPQDSFEAWEALEQTGKKYERFHKISYKWPEIRKLIREKVSNRTWQKLREICTSIVENRLDDAGRATKDLYDRLRPFQHDFENEARATLLLRDVIPKFDSQLTEISRYMKERKLDRATQYVEKAKTLLRKTINDLPPEVAEVDLLEQQDLRQLRNELEGLKDASTLLKRLKGEANTTDSVTGLYNLQAEVKERESQVPEQFRNDFKKLGDFVQARYSLLYAKNILDVAGDRDEAIRLLKQAKEHPDFKDEAEKSIKLINEKLKVADERVSKAIESIDRHILANEFWEAYSAAIEVANKPARKDLKQKLEEKTRESSNLAIQQSKEILEAAQAQNRGDPEQLKEHIKHLRILDPDTMEQLGHQIWPLVFRLYAERDVKQKHWDKASEHYREAADWAKKSNDPSVQAQEATYRARSKGSFKIHVLTLYRRIIPAMAVEFLNTQMENEFHNDADIMLAKAESLIDEATQIETEQEDMLQGKVPLRVYDSTRRKLNEAKTAIESAYTQASLWSLPQKTPDYEEARLTLLGTTGEGKTDRLTTAKDLEDKTSNAQWLVGKKRDIVSLLLSVSGGGASEA